MAYASWSVTFGEQPSASKWNILGTNDASFNDGTGLPSAGSGTATVATNQTTTSTSYADLTTTTDTVTATVGTTGFALVSIFSYMQISAGNSSAFVSYAVSGATTSAASDSRGMQYQGYGANTYGRHGATFLHTGLTPGSNTFKMKYRVDGGTGSFQSRTISVVPL